MYLSSALTMAMYAWMVKGIHMQWLFIRKMHNYLTPAGAVEHPPLAGLPTMVLHIPVAPMPRVAMTAIVSVLLPGANCFDTASYTKH